jgi:hypothetical protein
MAVLLCLGVSACAGTAIRNDAAVDHVKVQAVNQWAMHRHATVVWLNYPTIREKRKDG